jgi:hypothetical protein
MVPERESPFASADEQVKENVPGFELVVVALASDPQGLAALCF